MDKIIWKRILQLLKTLAAQAAFQKSLSEAARLWRIVSRMRIIKVQNLQVTYDSSLESCLGSADVHHVEVEFDIANGIISRNPSNPPSGDYRLVSFYNGTDGVSMWVVWLVALAAWWKNTNTAEVLSFGKNCDRKALGLGDSFNVAAMGVVVKRTSVPLSVPLSILFGASPVVNFARKEKDGREFVQTCFYLHDRSDNYPSGHHILFRV